MCISKTYNLTEVYVKFAVTVDLKSAILLNRLPSKDGEKKTLREQQPFPSSAACFDLI